jgi:hypothetical protein
LLIAKNNAGGLSETASRKPLSRERTISVGGSARILKSGSS